MADHAPLAPDASARRLRHFVVVATATTALTYFLISVGAIVRVSGAGMGCPDWPTCFGLIIPPMSVEELPPLGSYDYPPGWSVETFDPLMTIIEWVNRLIGVLVGLFITATMVLALRVRRLRAFVALPTFVAFVGVLYAGWLGARVVAHELAPWIVTVHLLSAIVVVSALVIALVNATAPANSEPPTANQRQASLAAIGVGVLALVQGSIGTQVRGFIEDVARANPSLTRGEWVHQVGMVDLIHRNLAILVVGASFSLIFVFRAKVRAHVGATRAAIAAGVLGVAQLIGGSLLVTLELPRAIQVFHLLCGALMLGALTAAAMLARRPA